MPRSTSSHPPGRLAAPDAVPPPPQGSSDMRLPQDVQQRLLAVAHRRTLTRGESLFHKGSSPDALFGVVGGSLRVSVVASGGREAVIAMLEPGHWFGEVSLLVGRERVYDTCAVDTTEMAVDASGGSGGTLLGVSQEDLSFMLGVSRQSVNRQLKLWEEDGTLRVRYRSIELLDREQLERHAATPS
jgi:CRP/FNR family cyclic AMP-dependent transcriptional regulator